MIKEIKTRQKNPTTNYAKDSHKAFCERCFKHNGRCPNTKTQHKDRKCGL